MVSQGCIFLVTKSKHNTVCRCAYWRAVIYQVMPMGVLRMSFQALGLDENCREARDVLNAWRRLAREHHPDKSKVADDDGVMMQELNMAKEQCLEKIEREGHALSEREFAQHICRVLDRGLERDGISGINMEQDGAGIIGGNLQKFYWIRTVDAMEWILRCGMGDVPFSQEIEDEIPILCKYYNEFIGEDRWSDSDHTMMMVLNKYDRLKAGGYGNFARFIDAGAIPTAVPPLSPQQGEEQSLLQ